MRLLVFAVLGGLAFAAAPTTAIKVDQVGYLSRAPKLAIVAAESAGPEFTVRRAEDDAVAFRGKLSEPVPDADSGDRVQTADFSGLSATGKYYLDVAGVGRSWQFDIRPAVYADLLVATPTRAIL